MPNSSTNVFAYLTDGTPETAARSFGLGRTHAGKSIGAFQIQAEDPYIGGEFVTLLTGSNETGWTPKTTVFLEHGPNAPAVAIGRADNIPAGLLFQTMKLRVKPLIAPRRLLDVTGEETIDGSMTLTIYYP